MSEFGLAQGLPLAAASPAHGAGTVLHHSR
jgi:hypothetical protein